MQTIVNALQHIQVRVAAQSFHAGPPIHRSVHRLLPIVISESWKMSKHARRRILEPLLTTHEIFQPKTFMPLTIH